jgi:hypothetical protein
VPCGADAVRGLSTRSEPRPEQYDRGAPAACPIADSRGRRATRLSGAFASKSSPGRSARRPQARRGHARHAPPQHAPRPPETQSALRDACDQQLQKKEAARPSALESGCFFTRTVCDYNAASSLSLPLVTVRSSFILVHALRCSPVRKVRTVRQCSCRGDEPTKKERETETQTHDHDRTGDELQPCRVPCLAEKSDRDANNTAQEGDREAP